MGAHIVSTHTTRNDSHRGAIIAADLVFRSITAREQGETALAFYLFKSAMRCNIGAALTIAKANQR